MKKAHKAICWDNQPSVDVRLTANFITPMNLTNASINIIDDRVDNNNYTRLEPMICERCGGTINPETLKCEHCGTYYRKVIE